MIKMKTWLFYFFVLITGTFAIMSCQKEIDGLTSGVINPADLKPKVGTVWTYRYYTYYLNGQLATTRMLTYRAKNEETIGGEKWLNVVDVATDTTVYLLRENPDGLYLNAGGNPYLFCKAPAVINDSYNVLYESWNQNFMVKGVNDTLPTGVGDVPANYYEGYIGIYLVGKVWYNKNAWVVRKVHYRKFAIGPAYYKFSELYIESIIY
jgi:hypothetical protein